MTVSLKFTSTPRVLLHRALHTVPFSCWEERIDLLPARWQGTAAGLQGAMIHAGMAPWIREQPGLPPVWAIPPSPEQSCWLWLALASSLTHPASCSLTTLSPVTAGVRLWVTSGAQMCPQKAQHLGNLRGPPGPVQHSVAWAGSPGLSRPDNRPSEVMWSTLESRQEQAALINTHSCALFQNAEAKVRAESPRSLPTSSPVNRKQGGLPQGCIYRCIKTY